MTRTRTKVFVDLLDEVLRPQGFTRKKKAWSLANEETILVADLQKSPVGNQYYINLGVFLRCLSNRVFPQINMCHIVERLDALVDEGTPANRLARLQEGNSAGPVRLMLRQLSRKDGPRVPLLFTPKLIQHILRNRPSIDRALDLDEVMSAQERKNTITIALQRTGLPFLQSCDSLNKICQALKKGTLRGAAVWKVVYELCKVPLEGDQK